MDEIAQLARVGQPGGPDEATANRWLSATLAGPKQRSALQAIAQAMSRGPVPESVRVACAHALVSRGESKDALAFLEGVSDTAALMLKADLLHDEGQIALAVAVIERVLARSIDTPGARERHTRWRSTLAPKVSRQRTQDDVTMAVPSAQQTPFRILREAARGGAGTVYEARDDVIGRPLALKVYHQVAMDRPQIRREAQVAVRLAGLGVVRVYDADFEAGWIALEWLAGGSLREVIRRKSLAELGDPLAFASDLARALARVHAQGWVHADVKPANVLIGASGRPILSDFGIAVGVGEASVGGSAGFLSPERLAGSALSPSDDVYGFGRILEDAAAEGSAAWAGMRRLAERCMGPVGARPEDGRALLGVMESGW